MKTILVLAKTFDSGIHWVNKHGHHLRDRHVHQWYVLHEPTELRKFLLQHQKIDVEGYILPEFTENKQKQTMINLLYAHKRSVSHRCVTEFTMNVLIPLKDKLGIGEETLSQEEEDILATVDNLLAAKMGNTVNAKLAKHFFNGGDPTIPLTVEKQWTGTKEEYIAIPVKDPNTIYSITA